MSNLMLCKLGIAIILGGVAAAAVAFYFWNEEIDSILEDRDNNPERDLLEKCFRSEYANNDRKNSN